MERTLYYLKKIKIDFKPSNMLFAYFLNPISSN